MSELETSGNGGGSGQKALIKSVDSESSSMPCVVRCALRGAACTAAQPNVVRSGLASWPSGDCDVSDAR